MSDTFSNLKELEGLSEKEKEYVLKVMKELSQSGTSEAYDKIKYADYKEIPVDIETFLRDDRYLGQAWKDATGNFKLYPYWLEKLKELFPDNLTTNYTTLLESGARGLGKAQPLDALVLAENGYIKMGDIHLGDCVFGNDGKLHKVVGVFPQGIKNICKVTFNDGTSTLCCDEHLWTVYNVHTQTWSTLETKELMSGSRNLHREFNKPFNSHRYKIPMTSPIEFEHRDTVIPAYTLGVLLGDGSLTNGTPCFTSFDDEIVESVNAELPDELELHLLNSKRRYYSITKKDKFSCFYNKETHCPVRCKNPYWTYIQEKQLNVKSECKYIPDDYLINDVQTRLSILQGLLDTDGYINADESSIDITTTSIKLAEGVKFIVESLGGTCRLHLKKTSYVSKKTQQRVYCRDAYIVRLKLPKSICPFRLTRKKDRLNNKAFEPTRYIESIEYVGQEECQCILLNSEEHLYLTNDCIVTHNSEVACGAVGAYLMYRVMCLKNPLEFYHLKPTEKIVFAFMNIKLDLAEQIAIDKFQKTIQMSPWFMSKGTMTQRKNKPYWNPPEPLSIVIGSQSDDIIGLPVYFAFFDEISFIRNQDIDKQKAKAQNMIDTALGGMLTRFIYKGKNPTVLVVASSKRSEQSFMEEYIKTLSEVDGHNTLVVDEAVWDVKPKGTYSNETFIVGLGDKFHSSIVIPQGDYSNLDTYRHKGYKLLNVPIDFKAKFLGDIDRALCDYAGISTSSLNKYMSAEVVSQCISSEVKNPFPDIIEVGNAPDDVAQYKDFFNIENIPQEFMEKPLFVHLDMSISGDMTGIAGVWISGKKPSTDATQQAKDLSFRLAFSVSVKAPKGRQISFEKNRNFIRWLKASGFNVKGVTADTFQSYDLLQTLKSEGFNCNILSVDRIDTDRVCKPYQYLKNTVYEQRIKLNNSERLFDEFTSIERDINTGKVDHPPKGHKDALDAVCGATFSASQHAEEFAYDYGEDIETLLDSEEAGSDATQQQIINSFTQDLQSNLMPKVDETFEKNNHLQYIKSVYNSEAEEIPFPTIEDGIIVL